MSDRLSKIFIGLGMIAMSAGFGWFTGLKPLLFYIESANWPIVPCTVIHSKVLKGSNQSGAEYRPEIQFNYDFQGVSYAGGSYTFYSGAPSSEMLVENIIERYPVGLKTQCLVNPDDPSDAVLVRHLGGFVWIALFFSLLFIVAGGLVIVQCLRGFRMLR
jgi:Protein of unknown function (DUF3592).